MRRHPRVRWCAPRSAGHGCGTGGGNHALRQQHPRVRVQRHRDGDGGAAVLHVQAAADVVQPGQTIEVSGTHPEDVTITQSGTAAAPITIDRAGTAGQRALDRLALAAGSTPWCSTACSTSTSPFALAGDNADALVISDSSNVTVDSLADRAVATAPPPRCRTPSPRCTSRRLDGGHGRAGADRDQRPAGRREWTAARAARCSARTCSGATARSGPSGGIVVNDAPDTVVTSNTVSSYCQARSPWPRQHRRDGGEQQALPRAEPGLCAAGTSAAGPLAADAASVDRHHRGLQRRGQRHRRGRLRLGAGPTMPNPAAFDRGDRPGRR